MRKPISWSPALLVFCLFISLRGSRGSLRIDHPVFAKQLGHAGHGQNHLREGFEVDGRKDRVLPLYCFNHQLIGLVHFAKDDGQRRDLFSADQSLAIGTIVRISDRGSRKIRYGIRGATRSSRPTDTATTSAAVCARA
jgi:hypothetical protein